MALLELTMLQFIFWALLQAGVVVLVVGKLLGKGEIAGPLILWKSKKGLDFLNRMAKKKDFWEKYGDFGLILAFGFLGALYVFRDKKSWKKLVWSVVSPVLIFSPWLAPRLMSVGSFGFIDSSLIVLFFGGFSSFITFSLGQSAYQTILGYLGEQEVMAMAGPAVPGVNIEGSPFQGIPWFGWLVFPILIFVHEISHGILLRAADLGVKNTGVAFFGLLPAGAFVEPEEDELEEASIEERGRVYSVGSTSNYVTAFVFLLISLVIFSPLMASVGVSDYSRLRVVNVLPESNAENLESGMEVISADGTPIHSIEDLRSVLDEVGAGGTVKLTTDKGDMNVKLNEEGKIGAMFDNTYAEDMPLLLSLLVNLSSFVYLVFFFNLVVGIMNLLPLRPLDGGLISELFLEEKIGEELANKGTYVLSAICLILLLINMLPLFIR